MAKNQKKKQSQQKKEKQVKQIDEPQDDIQENEINVVVYQKSDTHSSDQLEDNDDDDEDMEEELSEIQQSENDISNEQSEEQEFSSEQSIRKVAPAVTQMTFRSSRGQKMQQLLNKEVKDDESDDFWKENKYFEKIYGGSDDKEDISDDDNDFIADENLDEKDQFDSDFDDESDESEGDNEENAKTKQNRKRDIYDDEEEKEKKKKNKMLIEKVLNKKNQSEKVIEKKQKIIKAQEDEMPEITIDQDNIASRLRQKQVQILNIDDKKNNLSQNQQKSSLNQKEPQQKKIRYIHNFIPQEQLMKQAVLNEFHNQQSLEDLIQLQKDQKKYLQKKKQVMEQKITYHDSFKGGKHSSFIKVSDHGLLKNILGNQKTDLEGGQSDQKKVKKYLNDQVIQEIDGLKGLLYPYQKFKYKDPLTKCGYNTIDEYNMLKKIHLKQEEKKLKQVIRVYKDIFKHKEEHQQIKPLYSNESQFQYQQVQVSNKK